MSLKLSIFILRLEILEQLKQSEFEGIEASQEINNIKLYLVVLLIHELGHLLYRWNEEVYSPSSTIGHTGHAEAGFCLENYIFGSVISIFVSNETRPFDHYTKILGEIRILLSAYFITFIFHINIRMFYLILFINHILFRFNKSDEILNNKIK